MRLIILCATLSTALSYTNKVLKNVKLDIPTSTKSPTKGFPKWPTPVIESHGDYRSDAFIEKSIGGELYKHQEELPRLPVPSIEATIKTFLKTALPLAESEEERKSLVEACETFPMQAAELQSRLINLREELKDTSWLQKFWNTMVYLQYRDPVEVYVSYHCKYLLFSSNKINSYRTNV